MKPYDSEKARKIYQDLRGNPNKIFPVTALVVDGVLQNFVYGIHEKYPAGEGETIHLVVPGKILSLPGWYNGIRNEVQNILDTRLGV